MNRNERQFRRFAKSLDSESLKKFQDEKGVIIISKIYSAAVGEEHLSLKEMGKRNGYKPNSLRGIYNRNHLKRVGLLADEYARNPTYIATERTLWQYQEKDLHQKRRGPHRKQTQNRRPR